MRFDRIRNISFLVSFSFHLLLAFLFYLVQFQIEPDESEFVTLGFGTYGRSSKSGAVKKVIRKTTDVKRKKADIPKAKNLDDNNVTPIVKKKKEETKKKTETQKEKEILGAEEGNYGFQIDFGGKGIRKIYSYQLPEYPEGVSKEIDIKLRFTILPDGTVTNIFPLLKADSRLELAAINSLRQWRFEPVRSSQKRAPQNAVIVFPYRLR